MTSRGSFASAVTLSATAWASRTFINTCTAAFDVHGLPTLFEALEIPDRKGKGRAIESEGTGGLGCGDSKVIGAEQSRQAEQHVRRRGVVTVSNHTSILDDPLMWSILPKECFWPRASVGETSRNTRWTLGASDIMFTRPAHAKIFSLGQVLETGRGRGIFQPAVDEAVKIVQEGGWIHIFPEGRVNQPGLNPPGGLIRFKWGVSRIIMDSTVMPEIIPMWISGFDQVMPESRKFPRFLPRLGAKISITIGSPLTQSIQPLVDEWRRIASSEKGGVGLGGEWQESAGSQGGEEQRESRSGGKIADGKERASRIRISDMLQEDVRRLGEGVERALGKYESGEWTQSRPWVGYGKQGEP